MVGYLMLVCILNIVLFSQKTNGQEERVNVTVYYETLCPYAREFMVGQLHPFIQGRLSSQIQLELVPYGKATTTIENGRYKFNCHHKDVECYGNKLQACALILINNGVSTKNLGFNKDAVEFTICLMRELNPKSSLAEIRMASTKCAMNNDTEAILWKCVNDTLGSQFLANLGNITDSFQKPLGNVPTIVFNGKFNKEESDRSEKDFKKVFCSKIQAKNLEACSSGGRVLVVTAPLSILVAVLSLLVSSLFNNL